MQTIINEVNNTVFTLFGTTEELLLGVRYWVEQDDGKTALAWRVRVVENPNTDANIVNVKPFVEKAFPSIDWIGGGNKHASCSGAFVFKGSMAPVAIQSSIIESGAFHAFYEKLTAELTGVEFCDECDFQEVMREDINKQFPAPTESAAVIQFPTKAKATEEDPSPAELAGL